MHYASYMSSIMCYVYILCILLLVCYMLDIMYVYVVCTTCYDSILMLYTISYIMYAIYIYIYIYIYILHFGDYM